MWWGYRVDVVGVWGGCGGRIGWMWWVDVVGYRVDVVGEWGGCGVCRWCGGCRLDVVGVWSGCGGCVVCRG